MGAEMQDNLTLWQGRHWQINLNTRFGVPAYLFVNGLGPASQRFSALDPAAFAELGPAIGLATRAVEMALDPVHVFVGKFGMVPGHAIHFHVLPVTNWMLAAFAEDSRFHALAKLNPDGYPAVPDAAELIACFWRKFCFTGIAPVSRDSDATMRALATAISDLGGGD